MYIKFYHQFGMGLVDVLRIVVKWGRLWPDYHIQIIVLGLGVTIGKK